MRRPRLLLVVAIAVALAVGIALWSGLARTSPAASSRGDRRVAIGRALAAFDHLPAAPKPAFTPAQPVLLHRSADEVRWAPVIRGTVARRSPDAAAPAVADLSTTTPEGTTNLVVVKSKTTTGGNLWARVELPVLPNGTLGWIPRSALGGYHFVSTRLVVDRERLLATLYRDGRPVYRAPVGVGQPQWPTPPGEFYIREKLTKFESPFYGPIAFGTNARSPVLTDWPGGGFIGIHGTDRPDILPGRVSHGCVRLRNEDILRLDRLMPVGTPVTIE
jgi:hypothetical protein